MRSLWRHGLHGSSVLGVLCACLAVVIGWEFVAPPAGTSMTGAARAPSSVAKPAPAAQTFIAPSLAGYSEVVERPLFSTTRRSSARAAEETGNSTNLALVGTVVSNTGRNALIRHKKESRVERVVEGQDIEGWTVESIESDRVVLRRADSRLDLKANARDKP